MIVYLLFQPLLKVQQQQCIVVNYIEEKKGMGRIFWKTRFIVEVETIKMVQFVVAIDFPCSTANETKISNGFSFTESIHIKSKFSVILI